VIRELERDLATRLVDLVAKRVMRCVALLKATADVATSGDWTDSRPSCDELC